MKIAIGKRNLDERLEKVAEDPWLSRSSLTRRVKIHSSFPDGREILIELEAADARELGEALLRMAEDEVEPGGGSSPERAPSIPIHQRKTGDPGTRGIFMSAATDEVPPCHT